MRHWCFRSRFVSGVFLLMIAMMTACSHREKAAGQYLYAAIPETGQILVYPLSASGPAQPVATIKESPPDKPIDASVDMSGEVFVANENGNVRAYGGQN